MFTLIRYLFSDYKGFVAWRYLLVNPKRVSNRVRGIVGAGIGIQFLFLVAIIAGIYDPTVGGPLQVIQATCAVVTWVIWFVFVLRHSKVALAFYVLFNFLAGLALLTTWLIHKDKLPFFHFEYDTQTQAMQATSFAMMLALTCANLTGLIGTLRAFFTFFTTVPISGVFIGTAALVCVLSVMSGFESDLRQKILGSNAHIQITRESGDFTEWREVKKQVDAIPGVVASTPYAVSEVVIAANNNGQNVIIKGIDPATVGKVTDLVNDIEAPDMVEKLEAMKRLMPLVDDPHDLRVVQPKQPAPKTGVTDPPPDDMPAGGDPIDFSGPGSGSGSADSGSAGSNDSPYGGDARELTDDNAKDAKVVDPPPPDLVTSDSPPIDFSGSGSGSAAIDPNVHIVDVPIDTPSMSRRTQSLPGVLVGKELVKQTHIYTGEEVRVVSPLSDPSNPDATGTPIPFNRDYRVAGTFYTGMYEYDLKYVYVTLDSLQEFLDRGDAVDGIEIRVDDPDATDSYVQTISDELGSKYRVQDWKELNRSLFSALKLEKIAMFLVLFIVIVVASFSIVGNLIMIVVEKQKEIALLKTLGASDWGVMTLFAIQGLLIGALGTGLGVGIGLLNCWAGQRFGIPLNPEVYYIDRMPVHVELQSVVLTAVAGVAISILATFYPAFMAARVRPAAGMRH